MSKRVLFVDDEMGIRMTLAAILGGKGFDVSVAATVPEALQLIHSQQFDILLADLNIGQPGDGFTLVSAMRRSQPRARTFILTGYPDFASALTAIRNQVDDYFTKPADIEKLIETFNEPAAAKRPERSVPLKRISVIIREHQEEVIERWLTHCRSNPELSRTASSQDGKIDHLPKLSLEIADRIENHPEKPSKVAVAAAAEHGVVRHKQGYTIPMLLVEASILEKTIAGVLQERLLSVDISTLIPDMHQMSEAINCAVETSVRAYLELDPAPRVA